MSLAWLDIVIIGGYLAAVTVAGALVAGRQKSSQDYFLGGRDLRWWAVGFSIVASETSTLTFISVPGLAYQGDMRFLQLGFGYVVGRLLVSLLFIPAYYEGRLETAYDFLGKRFGVALRRFASSVFIITRVLASGVRLFATAIPVHLITGLDYAWSITLVGGFTLLYTVLGGLKAVVAMDVLQLFIYLGSGIASMVIILQDLPGGWSQVVQFAAQATGNKFQIVHFSGMGNWLEFLATPYTLAGGVLGGTFLSMASHGTDQLLVQRLLGCKSRQDSQKALVLDALFIVIQFGFFLVLGLCLFAFYNGASLQQLGLKSFDEVFPKFILGSLPRGIAGLVVAGVLASAMGTLSSSINSLASATYLDLFRNSGVGKSLNPAREMVLSRIFTLFWGGVLIGGAMLFQDTRNPVVELGLRIASITYGGILGTFFLGLFFKKVNQKSAFLGFIAGLASMVLIVFLTRIDFTWHTLIGCAVTLMVGCLSSALQPTLGPNKRDSA
jgi:solute:Na+ symporter, SSS family